MHTDCPTIRGCLRRPQKCATNLMCPCIYSCHESKNLHRNPRCIDPDLLSKQWTASTASKPTTISQVLQHRAKTVVDAVPPTDIVHTLRANPKHTNLAQKKRCFPNYGMFNQIHHFDPFRVLMTKSMLSPLKPRIFGTNENQVGRAEQDILAVAVRVTSAISHHSQGPQNV